MNRQVTFLTLCVMALVVFTAPAQTASIKVSYDDSKPNPSSGETNTFKMQLVAGTESSLYYNTMSMYCDSICSTPGGEHLLKEIQMKAWTVETPGGGMTIDMRRPAPRKEIWTYVVKDSKKSTSTVYDKWGDTEGVYTEPFDEIQWQLADSVKNILGYECTKATTSYHGRRWTAWFTPEIPLLDGPWKFRGLPGLILEVSASPDFSFVATGIETESGNMPSVYSPGNYTKVDRKKALSDAEYFFNHRMELLSARFGGRVTYKGNGKPEPKFIREQHAIETDYKSK